MSYIDPIPADPTRQQIIDDMHAAMSQPIVDSEAYCHCPVTVHVVGDLWRTSGAAQQAIKDFESTSGYKVVIIGGSRIGRTQTLAELIDSHTIAIRATVGEIKELAQKRHGPQPHHSKKPRHREFKTKKGNGRK